MNNISCVYYPTTTVIVDDQDYLLDILQLRLGHRFPSITYTDPNEALNFLKKEVKKGNALKNLMGIDTESAYYSHQSVKLPVQYDVTTVYQQIYNPDRFSEISVLIVDYSMPNMNGDVLCAALRRSNIKIILLTGAPDRTLAVKLLNAGLIDRFHFKNERNLDEVLFHSIADLQRSYFQDLTAAMMKGLCVNEDSALNDPAFTKLFHQIRYEIGAVGYYLIDLSGSFLFLNSAGIPTWLIIKTRNELEEIATELQNIYSDSPWAKAIKQGEQIPYFPDGIGYFDIDNPCYSDYWYPAQFLQGHQNYSYAIVSDLKGFPINQQKICPFNDYLKQLPY